MDWQFKVGIGTAVVFGLLPYAVKDMPQSIVWVGIAGGALFCFWGLYPEHERLPIGPTLLLIASLAGMAGSVSWFYSSSGRSNGLAETREVPTEETSLGFFMECDFQTRPITAGADGRVYFSQIVVKAEAGGGLAVLTMALGAEYKFRELLGLNILRCQLTNYEQTPALNVMIPLVVRFREIIRPSVTERTVGKIIMERPWPLKISKVDPGSGNSFTFYLVNDSPLLIDFDVPDHVTIQSLGNLQAKTAKLTVGSAPMLALFPLEEPPIKGLPAAPPPTPAPPAPPGMGAPQ
jgi:hypothetical protein